MTLFRRNPHLTGAALLLLLEGDLRERTLRRAARHLSSCPACRDRLNTLRAAVEQVSSDLPGTVAPAGAARERLALALAQKARLPELGWRERVRRSSAFRPAMLLRAGIVIALLVVAVAWRQLDLPLQDLMAAYEETGPEPNRVLTPGAASPAGLDELCGLSDFDLDPRVSQEKQRAVFHAYGLNERAAARAYQIDYLINPQLGGNDDLANLWPEPYHATVWNARAKDALEARLHRMVCSGQIDLQAAQQDLSTDWIAAYKKYFHTRRPVSTLAEMGRAHTSKGPQP